MEVSWQDSGEDLPVEIEFTNLPPERPAEEVGGILTGNGALGMGVIRKVVRVGIGSV